MGGYEGTEQMGRDGEMSGIKMHDVKSTKSQYIKKIKKTERKGLKTVPASTMVISVIKFII